MTDTSTSTLTVDAQPALYEAKIGLLFKRRLTITHEGIHWKGRVIRFSDVVSTGWGGTSRSYNGIPTGTVYDIHLDDRQQRTPMRIKTRQKAVYGTVTDIIWQHAGIDILTRLLTGLKSGERYVVGNAVVTDEGIHINRKKLFKAPEAFYFPWQNVQLSRYQGTLTIMGARNISQQLSYNENNNTHIIDRAITIALEHGLTRLSDMLPSASE